MAAEDWVSDGSGGWFNQRTGQFDFSGQIPLEVLQANQVGVTPKYGTPIYYTDPGPVPTEGMTYAQNLTSGGTVDNQGNTVLQGQYLQPGQAAPSGWTTSAVPAIQEDNPDPAGAGLAMALGGGFLGAGAAGLLSSGAGIGSAAGYGAGLGAETFGGIGAEGIANSFLCGAAGAGYGSGIPAGGDFGGIGAEGVASQFSTPLMPPAGTVPANPGATPTLPPAGAPTSGGGSGGTTGTGGTLSSLKTMLENGGSIDDWLKVGGAVLPGVISAFGSTQQSDKLMEIADRARADRAPYLAKSMEWLNNPASFYDTAGKQSLEATLRALSVGGNPVGDPAKLALASNVGAKNWMSGVTGFGNLGLAGEDTRAALSTNAVNTGNIWPNLGDAAKSVFSDGDDDITKLLATIRGKSSAYSLA